MCQNAQTKTHTSIQVQRRASGLPCAMVLTAYSALSPATNSSCHRHRRISGASRPGWADITSADLTPATDARTTRLCRPQLRRSSGARRSLTDKPPCDVPRATTLSRPPHPAPNVRDDGQRPSVRARDSGKYAGDLPSKKSRIFLSEGLDRLLLICPSGKSAGHAACQVAPGSALSRREARCGGAVF